jgi:F-type H+-transporting ATPase subunit b
MMYLGYIVGMVIALLIAADPALAAAVDEIPEWRKWWDLAWKIVNFLALAFIIVKMAKQPLKDFLKKQRETASEELAAIEERKKEAKAEQERIAQMTAGLAKELAEFETALGETAAKERQTLLDSAQSESKMILQRADIWAEQALLKAKQRLAAEMLDQAAEIASETIQKNITDQDREMLFDQFNSGLKESATL